MCPDLCYTMTPMMMSHESTGTFPGRESLSQCMQTSEMLKGTLPSVELTSLPSFPGGGVSLPLRQHLQRSGTQCFRIAAHLILLYLGGGFVIILSRGRSRQGVQDFLIARAYLSRQQCPDDRLKLAFQSRHRLKLTFHFETVFACLAHLQNIL